MESIMKNVPVDVRPFIQFVDDRLPKLEIRTLHSNNVILQQIKCISLLNVGRGKYYASAETQMHNGNFH